MPEILKISVSVHSKKLLSHMLPSTPKMATAVARNILTTGTLGLSDHSWALTEKRGKKKKQNCLNKLTLFNKMHDSNLFV